MTESGCGLCTKDMVLFEDDHAYVRLDNNSLSKGHVLVVPHRHVADFFEMTMQEKWSIIALLDRAKTSIDEQHGPQGYNIGVNVGRAAGQNRMHVHVHLIPRYHGEVEDPRGGVRSVRHKKQVTVEVRESRWQEQKKGLRPLLVRSRLCACARSHPL